MQKKEYKQPQIITVSISSICMLTVSGGGGDGDGKVTIPKGELGDGNEPKPDENGWIWAD
mgnify:FL=1